MGPDVHTITSARVAQSPGSVGLPTAQIPIAVCSVQHGTATIEKASQMSLVNRPKFTNLLASLPAIDGARARALQLELQVHCSEAAGTFEAPHVPIVVWFLQPWSCRCADSEVCCIASAMDNWRPESAAGVSLSACATTVPRTGRHLKLSGYAAASRLA